MTDPKDAPWGTLETRFDPIHSAARVRDVQSVQRELDAGVDVNKPCEHGRTALHMAAAWGHADVVRLLMENGADPEIVDEKGMTPLMVARNGYCITRACLSTNVKRRGESGAATNPAIRRRKTGIPDRPTRR